jgi:5-methylcytosine-specific restriction endonuclease McrA
MPGDPRHEERCVLLMSALTPAGSTSRWRTIRAYVLRRDRYLCRIGAEGCTSLATHVDHIVPREMGGGDEETNLRAACKTCNLGRPKAKPQPEPPIKRVSSW